MTKIEGIKKFLEFCATAECDCVGRAPCWSCAAKEALRDLEIIEQTLNPRQWTKEMNDAWHKNIPDVYKAFEALRKIAR